MMRKFIAYQFSNEPLQIKSVIAPEGVKGYIYIEAYKQPHVKQAILNVSNLRMGQWTQQVCWYIIRVESNVYFTSLWFYKAQVPNYGIVYFTIQSLFAKYIVQEVVSELQLSQQ